MPVDSRQRTRAQTLLAERGIVRLAEFRAAGATAATISRMEQAGEIVRLARGLYQSPDADLSVHHSLAEAAKRVPKGVICLVSALAFHDLTDQLPGQVWLAIGTRDWQPKSSRPPLRVVRFAGRYLAGGIETHLIEGVPVKIFGVAKTIADCFRHRRSIGLSVALEGLQQGLRQRRVTPAEIIRQAELGGVASVIRPYLEALTVNG
ncbi:MAG: type IV toxin-antitoxin system AbiEi family antitoxin domain-containing protein [Hyphomicrobiaceae bacterium]